MIVCLALLACLHAAAQTTSYKPLIGISTSVEGGREFARTNYSQSVRRAGGIPVLLPLLVDERAVEEVVSRLDGIVMSGGPDVHPLRYGEEPILGLGKVDPVRDHSDEYYILAALRLKKPILAICRGEQIANVVLGGTLYQDLPSQLPGVGMHDQRLPGAYPSHSINICPESRLYTLMGGRDSLAVNSFHHQAVKRLGKGLKVAATAPDGVIEAIEGFPEYDLLGVQFHPEFFAASNKDIWINLFKDLVERASKAKEKAAQPE